MFGESDKLLVFEQNIFWQILHLMFRGWAMKIFRKRIVSLHELSLYDRHKTEKHHKTLLIYCKHFQSMSDHYQTKYKTGVKFYNVIKAKFLTIGH